MWNESRVITCTPVADVTMGFLVPDCTMIAQSQPVPTIHPTACVSLKRNTITTDKLVTKPDSQRFDKSSIS